MSLADFYDNVTTPGFLAASFDEWQELCKEIKEDAIELVEEGEELFTDGFKEMVIKDNNDYKTSINKRNDGNEEIKAVQKRLLEARGITKDNQPIVDVLKDEFKYLIEAIEDFEKPDVESACNELGREFPNVTFKRPEEMVGLHKYVVSLLEVPEAPAYEAPISDEKVRRFGPVGIFTSSKKNRVAAADKYLEAVGEYIKQIELEIEKQEKYGLLFDIIAMSEEGKKLVAHFGKSYWSVKAMCGILSYIKKTSSDDPDADEKEQLRRLLMLAAGIYSISIAAMIEMKGTTPVSEKLIEELTIIKEQITLTADDDEGECEDETMTEDNMKSGKK